MKWMVPANNLDVVQTQAIQDILDNLEQNHWVKGFAGTGKTIVLTHVLERLAALKPTPKVCFATYTHALKDMVESGLSAHASRRIDIATFTRVNRPMTRSPNPIAHCSQSLKTSCRSLDRQRDTPTAHPRTRARGSRSWR
jgi:hypothetical protein